MHLLFSLLLLLLPPSLASALEFSVEWDLTLVAQYADQPQAIGIDWGESQGSATNTLVLSDFNWGRDGYAVGESIFNPQSGNLNSSVTLHDSYIYWQEVHPSAVDPLRFHISLTENNDRDNPTYGEIAILVFPFNNVCLEPCAVNIGIFGDFEYGLPGHDHIWQLGTGGVFVPGLNEWGPAPVLSNITWAATPEASTVSLCVIGIVGVLLMQRRRVPRKNNLQ